MLKLAFVATLLVLSEGSRVWQRGFKCHYEGQYHDPGDNWTASDGCNQCSCHRGDLIVYIRCTENTCTKASTGHCEYKGTQYKAGEEFQSADKCNTCTCMNDGGVACTDMACLLNNNPVVKDVKRSSVYQMGFKCLYNGQHFRVGDSWTASDGCNTCSCHAGDLVVRMSCTETQCSTAPSGQCIYNGRNFKAGESFKSTDKCNTCTCTSTGGVACTEMACILNERPARADGCTYNSVHYAVGDSFQSTDHCNKCFCQATGLVVCTKRACIQTLNHHCTYNHTRHNIGSSFPSTDGCNMCSCDKNAMVVCTEIACFHTSTHCTYNNKQYNVGDSFTSTDGCNRCGCSSNGMVMCTERACAAVGK